MKPWQNDFNVELRDRVDRSHIRSKSYFIISKSTNKIIFPKTRQYGYSTYQDACRGAAQLYNNIERDLLGKVEAPTGLEPVLTD